MSRFSFLKSSGTPPQTRDEIALYTRTCYRTSRLVMRSYSTSFTLGALMLHAKIRKHIYALYGFVRFGDELVDTFHDWDKQKLLNQFRTDTFEAIETGFSMNPILHAFAQTVREFGISPDHVRAFLHSMELDIHQDRHTQESYQHYIHGSAEAVGLMSLYVLCDKDMARYESLKPAAIALSAAFQKINFLRDLRSDYRDKGRVYFPQVVFEKFDEVQKKAIHEEIAADLKAAYEGILRLPPKGRLGVYTAYSYFNSLHRRMMRASPAALREKRLRSPDAFKLFLLLRAYLRLRLISRP